MNEKVRINQRSETLKIFLELGLPIEIISEYFSLTPQAIRKSLKSMPEYEANRGKILPLAKARPGMLKLLADISFGQPPEPLRQSKLHIGLIKSIILEHFQANKIIEILDYASYHLETLACARFDGVSEGYRQLLLDMLPSNPLRQGQSLWNAFLFKVFRDGNASWLRAEDPIKSITDEILSDLSDLARKRVMPTFTKKVEAEINNILLPGLSAKQIKVITLHYGLSGVECSRKEIADDMDMSATRVGQVYHSALTNLKRRKEEILAAPLVWPEMIELLAYKRHVIEKGGGETPLSRTSLSPRAKNMLKFSGYWKIKDLEGLTLPDLKKIRNLGDKAAAEITAVMAEFGFQMTESGFTKII